MKRTLALLLALTILLPTAPILSAQTTLPGAGAAAASDDSQPALAGIGAGARVQLARGTPDYPVTPGDEYLLGFDRGGLTSSVPVVIAIDGTADFGAIGTIDTAGLTLEQFRRRTTELVQRAYPGSFPQLRLVSVGTFQVVVSGEIPATVYRDAWGLTRLSDIVATLDTAQASRRRVLVRPAGGGSRSYDLQLAERLGRQDQNPFIRPGDRVELTPRGTRVSVGGEVRFPGRYELLPGDRLSAVVERYAGGFTEFADRERIVVDSRLEAGESRSLPYQRARSLALVEGDVVTVRSTTERLPVVYFEGAFLPDGVQALPEEDRARPPRRSQIIRRPYLEGESLYSAVLPLRSRLHPEADLRGAFIRRNGRVDPIPVDLEALLFAGAVSDEIQLQAGDRVIVPFGVFEVFVTGEVTAAGFTEASSLERLGTIVEPFLTEYSSIRDIEVRTAGGDARTFDLFRARRFGERDEDPRLNPGDTVVVNRLERRVSIAGEVERPGTYQLLAGDTLADLITDYGSGLTIDADPTTVRIISFLPDSPEPTLTRTVDLRETDPAAIQLTDRDRIFVRSRTEFLPVVFFEGAVDARDGDTAAGVPGAAPGAVADQLRYQFNPGETIADAARAIRERFLTTADLSGAFIERVDGTIIPVDLATFLFSEEIPAAVALRRNDRVVVPFRQYFVTVSGAVANPGQYPYIPNRTYDYYLGLAGGTDPQRHIGNNPRITSVANARKPDDAIIEPEDDIFFASTNPLYHLSPIVSLAATILSTVAIVLSLTP